MCGRSEELLLRQRVTGVEGWHGVILVSLLSLFALAVQGFHPYAEDGGLYVAGVKKMLNPALYPVQPEFVLAPLRFSPFAPFVAAVTRMTHLPLPWALLALYCISIWVTLYAGWMIAVRCTTNAAARSGAVALLACWLTMPIAGTSLMLTDPYVTARSISTPLTLFAVAWALDALAGSRLAALFCALALILAAVHPLMAAYALAAVSVLLVSASPHRQFRRWGSFALCLSALAVAAIIQAAAPAESANYIQAAITRYYWFPLRWRWYEQFGLIAPLVLLWLLGRLRVSERWQLLARMALLLGAISLAVALVFARATLSTHLVARLQPLRCFQIVYELMILLLGAQLGEHWLGEHWLGEHWLGRRAWRWGLLVTVLGGIMFVAQRRIYPASQHFELPNQQPRNPWSQAFLWIRQNTPQDALFALDANYITHPREDAQGFRAIAERSVLPDYSKDGGEASIAPYLANAWKNGQQAQTNLDAEDDTTRAAKLSPLGVTWVVLQTNTATGWVCPYRNPAVKVCRLPDSVKLQAPALRNAQRTEALNWEQPRRIIFVPNLRTEEIAHEEARRDGVVVICIVCREIAAAEPVIIDAVRALEIDAVVAARTAVHRILRTAMIG